MALSVDPNAMLMALLVGAGLVLIYKLFFAPVAPGTNFETMPGPSRPFGKWFGRLPEPNFMEWHKHFHDCGRTYGDLVRKRVMGRNIIVVTNPELIYEIGRDREHFLNRAPTGIGEIVPLGLLALDTNDLWANHRRTVSKMFADRYMRTYGEAIARLCQQLTDQWDHVPADQSINIHRAIIQLSLDAFGTCGFGTDFQAMTDPHNTYVEASDYILQSALLQTAFVPVLFQTFFRTIHRKSTAGIKLFEAAIDRVLSEAPETHDGQLHMLKELADSHMPERELKDELITMVLAGHETTANSMSWALYLLAKHPDAMKRVQAEVDAMFARPDFDPAKIYEYRSQLPLLRSAAAETLRLYPTVPVMPRICTKATTLNGYHIPAGTRMWNSLYAAFRHPKYFDRPDEFVVDRFLGVDIEGDSNRSILPFGAGQRFAMLEEVVVLSTLLHRYDFEIDKAHPIQDVAHITLTPKYGIKLFVRPRH